MSPKSFALELKACMKVSELGRDLSDSPQVKRYVSLFFPKQFVESFPH
jgi:hypothetical protein